MRATPRSHTGKPRIHDVKEMVETMKDTTLQPQAVFR
jgi:hypothetical protein